MWPVPSPSTPYLLAAINSSSFVDSSSFSKAGRKINVGDCALFKLPNGSPPFVGIIRSLIVGKEENLSLSVNWFYRPAEVKLTKGAVLEAAPNEVFYSFHKDEIPATSLLHPCKVSFLGKGVELPSGIFSFVCRRVYDIENKCLWWLTDQKNYIIKQEEVDELLDKTQAEMHGAVQTGGRSPKPLNAPNGTSQIKSSTDNNSSKSKKREQSVPCSPDSVKRECLSKPDKPDASQLRPEEVLKSELAKITDKGGLVDFEGVEKLIQLMQPESSEKKIDLPCRVILADVVSVTDRFDCLGRFVQRRGLLILDEWLQEVHKGKIGDGSPKGSDKSVEEFLFALLRALDRLPVNLHALQTCNVGKSVNHLRSHKNSEIQKKARSLVDTWKKRVEAEMNIIETRSGARRGGSWPNKSMMSEVSHMGSRRVSGSSEPDTNPKPSPLKAQPGKPNSSEPITKSPESPSPTKPPAPVAGGSSDVAALVTIKEEKSSSCSPSGNNSSCSPSSDHGKTGASCREDGPTSTSGSISVNKISHSRKSNNVGQKVNRNKGSPVRGTPDVSFSDNMNNNNNNHQRLIVRLPNTGRTLGEDNKQESQDKKGRGKVDSSNNVAAMSSPVKAEECVEKVIEASKGTGSASDVTLKAGKSYETCYSSVNALVESCAKFSEANVSAPAGDDGGMNLLASVAAGEISPVGSSENKPPLPEDTCSGNDTKFEEVCQSEDNLKKDGSKVQTPVDSKVTSFPNEKTGETNAQVENGNVLMVPDVKPGETSVSHSDLKPKNISPSEEVKKENKVETQINDESASWSSSEKHEVEKKLVRKQSTSSNLEVKKEDEGVRPKAEEADAKENTDKSPEEKPVSEMAVKLDFDLNEVLPSEDGNQGHFSGGQTSYQVSGNRPGSVTVAAAAKGRFFPSENLLRGKAELGWKGSAATSAFRPVSDNPTTKPARGFLDFDLNVGVVEDAATNALVKSSSGGLGLDLNACEESHDVGQMSVRPPQLPPRSLLSGRFSNLESGFDLNGPGVEESGGGETVPLSGNGMQFMPNVRMGNMEMGNFSSWFPPSSTYSAIPIPAVVPGGSRGDPGGYPMVPGGGAGAAQRMLSPSTSYNPEMFRGPVLSSSPAVAFQSSMPFQFPGFPFEVTSNTYSGVSTAYMGGGSSGGPPLCFPSQMVGVGGVVSTPPYRPFMMSLPGGSSNIGPDGRRWGSHGLDLNAGPDGGGGGGGGGSEQLKVFQQMAAGGGSGGGVLKRKEPDDGWDSERISYKHPSWQ